MAAVRCTVKDVDQAVAFSGLPHDTGGHVAVGDVDQKPIVMPRLSTG